MRGRFGRTCALALATAIAWTGIAQAKTFEVTRKNDPAPGNCKRNDCSLREAVLAANERPGKDEIVLPESDRYKLTRANAGGFSEDAGTTGDLDVNNDPLAIVHPGKGKAKIDNDVPGDRVLHVQDGAPTRLSRIGVTGGDMAEDGGGISSNANLKLARSVVVNNATDDDGAGIDLMDDARLKLTRSAVVRNDAFDVAGGINADARVTIIRSRISQNTGDNDAGLDLSLNEDGSRISRSRIERNVASDDAGGMDLGGGSLSIDRSTISENRSGQDGGGIHSTDATEIVIRNSTISGNHANGGGSDGGGIYLDGPTVSISNSTISGNRATLNGGGIQAQDGADVSLNAVTVVRNVADEDGLIPVGFGGGGLYRLSSAGFDVRNSLIALNLSNTSPNDCDGDTPIDSLGNNLLSTLGPDGSCQGFDGPNDIVRTNPKLGKLRRNGGPTKTVALKKGSAAIGLAHKPSSPNRDQRGRKRDNNPDSGAFERGA